MFQTNYCGLKSKLWLIRWVNKPCFRRSFKPIKLIIFTQLTIRQILTKRKSINKLNNLLQINQRKIPKKHYLQLKTSKWQIKKTQQVYLTIQREAASSTTPKLIWELPQVMFRESRLSKSSRVRPLTSPEDPAQSTPVVKYLPLDPDRDLMATATTPRSHPWEVETSPPKIVTFATINLCPMPLEMIKKKPPAVLLTMLGAHLLEWTIIVPI